MAEYLAQAVCNKKKEAFQCSTELSIDDQLGKHSMWIDIEPRSGFISTSMDTLRVNSEIYGYAAI